MVTSESIGKSITLTKGSDSLTGILRSVYLSPEVIETVPGTVQDNYQDVWTPGFRAITVSLQVTEQDSTSPILTEAVGTAFYEIEEELYIIQSIDYTVNSSNRTAVISLIYKQGASENLDLPTSLTLSFDTGVQTFNKDDGFAFNTQFELELVSPATVNNLAFFHISFNTIPFHTLDNFLATRMSDALNTLILRKTVMARNDTLVQEHWTSTLALPDVGRIIRFKRVIDNKAVTKYMRYTFGMWGIERTATPG